MVGGKGGLMKDGYKSWRFKMLQVRLHMINDYMNQYAYFSQLYFVHCLDQDF